MNIYDIAKLAGVSIATVSRVLNGSENVRENTRRKVEAVMRQQGYTPNVFARGLGLNTMKMIGVLCTDVSDPFFAKAVSVIEHALHLRGYSPVLYCTGSDLKGKQEAMSLMLEKRVDAMILVGSPFRESGSNGHIAKAAESIPVVVVNGLLELPNVYCVLCNEYQAVRQNTMELIRQGCRKIFYCYDAMTYSGTQKLSGYQDALKEAGIPFDPSLVAKVPKQVSAVRELAAEKFAQLQFDAAEASEDLLAAGVLQATQGKIPVVGFNNSMIAECTSPQLTSVDNLLEVLCTTAVGLLSDLFEGREVQEKIVLEARLAQRESWIPGAVK